MNVVKLNNIFTDEELKEFNNQLDYSIIPFVDNNYIDCKENEGVGISHELGRLQFKNLNNLSSEIINKINKIVKNFSSDNLTMSHAVAVEYSNKYGTPNLPVHYDHDTNDLIINFQLSSNTSWDVGVDLEVYKLEDNSAIVFNGNEYTHWRPHKSFNDGEYIKMIFFRFCNLENPSDYSHLDYTIGHSVFEKVNAFRDSLQ